MNKCLTLIIIAVTMTNSIAAESIDKAILTVRVASGTQGGSVAESTPVIVTFYQQGQQIKQLTSTTDSEGNCIFEDIPTGSDIVAVAQAKHDDMLFSGTAVLLPTDQKTFESRVLVFDVVYDNTLISAGTHHLIIKKHDDRIRVTEYIQLTNDQDKAILSDQVDNNGRPKVVQIALPKGFENLNFSNYFHPDAVVVNESGFYDTMAIPPGQYHGMFSYDLLPQNCIIDFTKEITLPQSNVMVFIQSDGITVTGLSHPDGQMTLTDGVLTDFYTIDVSPGSAINFQIEVMKTESSESRTWLILGVVFALIGLVVLIRLLRQR